MIDLNELEEDIRKIEGLESQARSCSWQANSLLCQSRRDGSLFKFRYRSAEFFSEWFRENFERFKDKVGNAPYYIIESYGDKKDKQKLWNKRTEIGKELVGHLWEKSRELSEHAESIKKKYARFFEGVSYDLPFDGASDMTDFLTVALRLIREYQSSS